MFIRPLTPADAAEYRRLRVRLGKLHPEAFLETPEEDEARTEEEYAAQIAASVADGEGTMLGAFDEAGRLRGVVGVRRERATRSRHRALLWGMGVGPEARGRGVGRRLVEAAVDAARSWGIEQITLEVVASNADARRLYAACGFETFGVLRDSERYDGWSYDSEHMVRRLDRAPGEG